MTDQAENNEIALDLLSRLNGEEPMSDYSIEKTPLIVTVWDGAVHWIALREDWETAMTELRSRDWCEGAEVFTTLCEHVPVHVIDSAETYRVALTTYPSLADCAAIVDLAGDCYGPEAA